MYYPADYFPQNAHENCQLNRELGMIMCRLWEDNILIDADAVRPCTWNKEERKANLYVDRFDVDKFESAEQKIREKLQCTWSFTAWN